MNKKIVLVTGCSKKDGVGYNLVSELLNQDWFVIATVRNPESSQLKLTSFESSENLAIKQLDLFNEQSINALISDVLNDYGYIDVLVNNAAEVMIGAVETASQKDLQQTFQTKVFGPIALIQGFLPVMRKRKSGLLITTSSIFCTNDFTPPGFPVYLSALCAFERLQEALAIELAAWGIKVINFQPGPITTSLSRHEGSRKEVADYYKDFNEQALKWYAQNCEWQDAKAVAKIYAEIIANPQNFAYQSNSFGMEYVKQFRPDNTGDSQLQAWLKYFGLNLK